MAMQLILGTFDWKLSRRRRRIKKESTICQTYSAESAGIHSTWNDHFGIGVVEIAATGLVTGAQDLGGPKSDIIARPWDLQEFAKDCGGGGGGKRPTRCLASTAEELPMQCIQLSKGVQEKRLLLFNRVVIGTPRRDFWMKGS
jgi:hypothetical protein